MGHCYVQFAFVFTLGADFGTIDSKMQYLLFKKYCCTFYGAPLWRNNGASLGQVCIA